MLKDPDVYGDPESFLPERYLVKGTPDPIDYSFGYGRR